MVSRPSAAKPYAKKTYDDRPPREGRRDDWGKGKPAKPAGSEAREPRSFDKPFKKEGKPFNKDAKPFRKDGKPFAKKGKPKPANGKTPDRRK